MTTPPEAPAKRALVASDSVIASDPRVLNQIRWLVESGWVVDSLGRGRQAAEVNGRHYAMPMRPLCIRVLSQLVLGNEARYRVLVEGRIPDQLVSGSSSNKYDLVVVNEVEMLPWFTRHRELILKPEAAGHAHLDLHEYSPSQRTDLTFRLIFKRYRDWLITFIPSASVNTRSVVSPGIAKLYSELFQFPEPLVVRSCASYIDLAPSTVDAQDIRLVHHGSAALVRGPETLIEAMHKVDNRFSLHLMLVGSPSVVKSLKRKAAPLGSRVVFHEPVPVSKVSTALNTYDLEVIFFAPVTQNLRYVLPNKFFEAIQGRLGFVIGDSPNMVELVTKFDNGVIVDGWSSDELARAINQLQPDQVAAIKERSHAAAHELSSESERSQFFNALGINN